jgi:hypothetical protein
MELLSLRLMLQDTDTQLQPIVNYLTSLSLESQHVARMACVYPELLLSSVQEQLQPLVGYLQGLGCSAAQAARLLQVRPELALLAVLLLGVLIEGLRGWVAANDAYPSAIPSEQWLGHAKSLGVAPQVTGC